jgi:hypothetical protein
MRLKTSKENYKNRTSQPLPNHLLSYQFHLEDFHKCLESEKLLLMILPLVSKSLKEASQLFIKVSLMEHLLQLRKYLTLD